MKKIGSITSALGLIFYGIWLIFKKYNYVLAMEVFKWWPVVFIMLGIEIIIFINKKTTDKKFKFNYLIIPIILMFVCTNVYFYTKNKVKNYFGYYHDIGDSIKNGKKYGIDLDFFDDNDTKRVYSKKQFKKYGNSLYINVDNSKMRIQNSSDDNITIKGDIYIDEDKDLNEYEIKEKNVKDGYKILFDESYVRGEDIVVSVPKGYYIKIDGDNMKVDSVNYEGNIDVNCQNSNINLDGDIQLCNIKADNTKIDLKNEVCKNVNISADNGVISVKTNDSNLNLKANVDAGICKFNGDKRINSGISKKIGNGKNNLDVSMSNGIINIINRE